MLLELALLTGTLTINQQAMLLEPARLASIHEGCNLFGFLEVNKVAGNVHLAPGKAFQSAQGSSCTDLPRRRSAAAHPLPLPCEQASSSTSSSPSTRTAAARVLSPPSLVDAAVSSRHARS